jgi:hypothetical protein
MWVQARCAAASRAAEAAAAERDLLERKVARLEKGKETELKGEQSSHAIYTIPWPQPEHWGWSQCAF